MEEERGGGLRGNNVLHLLQQHPVPRAGHRRLLLPAEELQPNSVRVVFFLFPKALFGLRRMLLHLKSLYRVLNLVSPSCICYSSVPPYVHFS